MPPVSPPVGWTKGLQIDIGAAQIPTTISGRVPVLLNADSFTGTFLNSLQSTGDDLRFTSDDAGTQLLPRDIQYFDQVGGNIIVHVGLDSVTASTVKTIYAWANNSTASKPSPRDPSGSQTVWNNVIDGSLSYYGVCHFQSASDSGTLFPSDPGFKAGDESTGNWTPVNAGSGISDNTGPLTGQNAWELDNSNNIINLEAINSAANDSTVPHYLEFWIYSTAYPNSNSPIFVGDFNRYWRFESNGKVKMGDSGNASTNGYVLNQWNQIVLSRDGDGNVEFFLNGAANGTTQTTQDIENMNRLFQDRNNNGNGYSGARIAWLRVCRGSNLGGDHLAMQWNAVNSAATFATPSNETDFNPTLVYQITNLDQNAVVTIVNIDDDRALLFEGAADVSGVVTYNFDGGLTGANVDVLVRNGPVINNEFSDVLPSADTSFPISQRADNVYI